MAPNTVKTGIGVLDNAFGGIYLNFPTLVCGRRKSGKFIFATQVLARALRIGERAILFTSKRPEDIVSSMGTESLDVDEAISSGQLIICPYSSMHRNGSDPYAALQFPEVLDELSAIMKSEKIAYAVFDTVVPWTAIEPVEAMPDHVEKFISTLSSLDVTSLLLLPEPASPAATSLAGVLRELCPINIEMESHEFGANFVLRVTKFQGMAKESIPLEVTLDIVPGVGFEDPSAAEKPQLDEMVSVEPATEPKLAFRPFLSPSLASFSTNGIPGPVPSGPAFVESARTPQPSQATPPPPLPAAPRPATPRFATPPLAQPNGRASFASVVDLPEFPKR